MSTGNLPSAKSTPSPEQREKLRRIVVKRGLGGLANDTKWNELIAAIRDRTEDRPGFRYKCIDGPPSGWNSEWFYHFPFPMLSVEWMNLSCRQSEIEHRLPPRIMVTDHFQWLIPLLQRIGLDFQAGTNMIRIYGYTPRSLELFDQC